jgi:hypothetical protein
MAFTYSDELTTDKDRVRFSLQDTVEKKGPKPANGNFSDAEIGALLTNEDSWRLAVAAGFETLAAAWADSTSFSVVNGSFTRSDASRQYNELAKEWRRKYGESEAATSNLLSTTTWVRE